MTYAQWAAYIPELAGKNRRTIHRVVLELTAAGLVRIEKRRVKGGPPEIQVWIQPVGISEMLRHRWQTTTSSSSAEASA